MIDQNGFEALHDDDLNEVTGGYIAAGNDSPMVKSNGATSKDYKKPLLGDDFGYAKGNKS